MSNCVIDVEINGHVATVYLDRAEKRNAMGPDLFDQLPRRLGELAADATVRCIVIAGRGPDFSVGLDLEALANGALAGPAPATKISHSEHSRRLHDQITSLQRSISSPATCPQPVIAAIWGHCLGGGLDLASACDIRIAAENAIFALAEARMAMVADLGSLQRLPLIIGSGRLAEMAFTGRTVMASEALEIGLVNKTYPDEESALQAAHALARDIALNSPLAVQGAKAVISAAEAASLREGLERVALWNAAFIDSDDLREAVTAFFEKRPPSFHGS